MKKTTLIIVIIFFLGILSLKGMKQNVIINNEKSEPMDYYFKIDEKDNIKSVLSSQKYYYTTDVNKKYIAVITYQDDTASMKQLLTENGEEIELKIPYDSKIAISLPANRTIFSRWNLSDKNDDSILQLYDYTWIRIQRNIIGIREGENYDRQNFYFKALDEGNENFIMRYESMDKSIEKDDCFEINIKITIQK